MLRLLFKYPFTSFATPILSRLTSHPFFITFIQYEAYGFYSALIIFTLLFIIAAFFFIRQFVHKQVSPYNINTFMLGVLTLFMLIVSGIYSYDFYHLQTGDHTTAGGICEITFVNGHGKSINTTEVMFEDKLNSIKSGTYKD